MNWTDIKTMLSKELTCVGEGALCLLASLLEASDPKALASRW